MQRIKNEFTVLCYESHARIALENGDMNEFNQCQTQLKELYQNGLGTQDCKIEFTAYRILYCVFTQHQQKNSSTSRIEMNSILASLTKVDKESDSVVHALHVRKAVAMNNYHSFFQSYDVAPNLNARLMDAMLNTIRLLALRIMCASYRPKLEVSYILNQLHLDTLMTQAEMLDFLNATGLVCANSKSGRFTNVRSDFADTKVSEVVSTLSKTSLI